MLRSGSVFVFLYSIQTSLMSRFAAATLAISEPPDPSGGRLRSINNNKQHTTCDNNPFTRPEETVGERLRNATFVYRSAGGEIPSEFFNFPASGAEIGAAPDSLSLISAITPTTSPLTHVPAIAASARLTVVPNGFPACSPPMTRHRAKTISDNVAAKRRGIRVIS